MTSPNDMNDDDLGAALGESLRGRTNAVPTITPGFETVERRARQITNRRRALAGAAIGALVLLGGVGLATLGGDDRASDQDTVNVPDSTVPDPTVPDTDPTKDGRPADQGFETTVLIDGSRFVKVGDNGQEQELYAAGPGEYISEALALADGSFLVEVHDSPADIAGVVRHHDADGSVRQLADFGDLAGGAVAAGVPYAFVGDVPDPSTGGGRTTGNLRLVDLATGLSSVLAFDAYSAERSVEQVDVRGDLVLIASTTDAGPEWSMQWLSGIELAAPRIPDQVFEGPTRAFEPRLDRVGGGVYFLLELGNGSWGMSRADFDGTVGPLQTIDIDPLPPGGRLQLEAGVDGMVINVETAAGTHTGDAIWITDHENLTMRAETVSGYVSFIHADQGRWSLPPSEEPPTTTPETPETGEWRPLAELGLAGPRPSKAFDVVVRGAGTPARSLIGVVDGNVYLYPPTGDPTVLAGDPNLGTVMMGSDGSLLIELRNRPTVSPLRPFATAVIQIRDDEYRVLSADGRLTGVAQVAGRPVAFVGDLPVLDNTPDGDVADLRMVDLASGESTVIGTDVYGIEWLVYEVFVGGDPDDPTILLDGSGYQPIWAYRNIAGETLELASPTDGRYGSDWANEVDGVGPNADRPALSADGTTLYWVEIEPDGGTTGSTAAIHAMDTVSGDEGPVIEVPLGPADTPIHTDLTIDGDQLLLARYHDDVDDTGEYRPLHLAPIVIDLTTGETTELPIPGADWHYVG